MKKLKIFNKVKEMKQHPGELSLEPCQRVLEEINRIRLEELTDGQLKEMARELRGRALDGRPAGELLAGAFALSREAARRVLDQHPFDVQMLAGVALHYGTLAEMQTGEGKTLAAVAPAYLNALYGRGVHVLTFNDYLAKRDAQWMGPVYEFLGLTAAYVHEGMGIAERKRAYAADITYLTAREAGFDYLRGFLCSSAEELVQRPYNYAIVDEADSILIDEARIPLVIAGKTQKPYGTDPVRLAEIVGSLEADVDFSLDEYERNVFLTEKGTGVIERIFGCGNLYDERNLALLADVGNALHARALLKRDVDYIVRNGKIELVDEFTGRVADKRQWPYGLQEAIEAREGIYNESRGRIIASITLQNFIRLYPRISGMTGTASTASAEFLELYGLNVVVIPTNRECIRTDHPDILFTHAGAKLEALAAEIESVHGTGRPILIGTRSVEESERLAGRLKDIGIRCSVLNAKNDEEEARIIARAGAFGAVTVSTNMAGRGTDIKLGGENEEDRDRIVGLGGLYVIGTNRYESRRIDNQLRGRAGRQGDPGSTRFFISLEDDLMKQYKLKELIPEQLYPKEQEGPLENKFIRNEMARAQRIIEGQNFEIRRTLGKYNVVVERQRQMIYNLRRDILFGAVPGLMKTTLPRRYAQLLPTVGAGGLAKAEGQASLHHIWACWADYLDFISYTRESIHLVNMAGKIPVSEFNKTAIDAFEKLKENIRDEITATLEKAEITADGINLEREGLKAPSSTWTYLIDDSPEQLGIISGPLAFDPFSVMLWTATMTWHAVRKFVLRKSVPLK